MRLIVATPETAFFVLVPTSVPGPETVNVTALVAVVMAWLQSSRMSVVIRDVAVPSAVMLAGAAVFERVVGLPTVMVTATVSCARLPAVAVTVAVPSAVVDRKRIVAIPVTAFFVDVSRSVPAPETVKVRALVALVTALLLASATVEVIKAVAVPLAIMLVTPEVFMTLAAVPNVVVTSTVP